MNLATSTLTVYVGETRSLHSRAHIITPGPSTLCGISRAQIRHRRFQHAHAWLTSGYRCRTCERIYEQVVA